MPRYRANQADDNSHHRDGKHAKCSCEIAELFELWGTVHAAMAVVDLARHFNFIADSVILLGFSYRFYSVYWMIPG